MRDGERKNKRTGQRLKLHNKDSNGCQFMSIPTTLVESVYRKCSNIGGTFNLAIEHIIAKLKTANILAHAQCH